MGRADLQLLGIGHNGHIGFNEPADPLPRGGAPGAADGEHHPGKLPALDKIEDVPTTAITMGIGLIMLARKILLIAGADKRAIVEEAFYGKITPQVPASILQLHPDVTVILAKE